jgi:hypothetical protein
MHYGLNGGGGWIVQRAGTCLGGFRLLIFVIFWWGGIGGMGNASYFGLPYNGLFAIEANNHHLPSFAKDEKQDKRKTAADGS